MKKVLFATTALVATAGVAAADVTFGGYGRFGLQHQENRITSTGGVLDETIIESRFRLNIDASTESDAGVTFGARVRIQADDNANGSANTAGFNGARFHAETGGFRLEVGNIAHALDNLANYYGYEPGLIGAVGQYANYSGPVNGYSSTGAGVNGVSAIYSMGDFRAQLSYSSDNDGNFVPAVGTFGTAGFVAAANTGADVWSASVAYTFSGWTVALGHESAEDDDGITENDGTVLTVGGSLGVADVALFIGDDKFEGTSYGVSGSFDVGASTKILASVSGGGDDVTTTKKSSYGIGFDHDLGGGVALRGMVGRNTADQTVADLGVIFNF